MTPPGECRRNSCNFLPICFLTIFFNSFILALFPATASAASSAVIGIDLGTEYLKAALVKPGIPLEIVLTKDSKRKEAAAVAFKPSRWSEAAFPERFYGSDALALAARFPDDVYANLKVLLGIPFSTGIQGPDGGQENAVTKYKNRYPAVNITEAPDGRGTVGFKSRKLQGEHGREPFLVEELLSMQLKQLKANAEAMGGQGTVIRDAVLTFPPFYTAEEKRSLRLAAELAGLNVLGLISDGLAIGLNYATSRTFPSVSDGETPEYHVVYDMGAGSTTATLLRFQSRIVKDVGRLNKTVQEVQVLGIGWDKTLGGDALNQVIVDNIIKKFQEAHRLKDGATVADLKAHGKTMAKLWKESEKIRQILSANTDTMASFEGLFHDDVNFKYKLSRSDLEQLAKDYARRVSSPLMEVLSSAKMGLDELDSVILHGGAARTPFVQKELESIFKGSSKIRTNVNADEAAVFGAAFKGAALSPSFRAKEIRTGDTPGFAIALKWNSGNKMRQQKIFTPYSEIGSEKQVTVKNLEDFEFSFSQQFSRGEKLIDEPILGIQTKNLTDSIAKLKETFGCAASNITAKFSIRLSLVDGLPEVVAGLVECEVQNVDKKGVVEDMKEFFGLGSKRSEQQPLGDDHMRESVALEADSSLYTSSPVIGSSLAEESASASPSKGTAKSPTEMKSRVESIPIAYIVSPLGTPRPSVSEMQRIKERLAAFDASDLARIQREEVINTLETLIYRARDLAGDEGFRNYISQEALLLLEEKLSHASDWLYGDGADASTQDVMEKVNELKELVDPALKRKSEHARRPLEVDTLKQSLSTAKMLLSLMQDTIAAEERAFSASPLEPSSVALPSELPPESSGALSSPSSSITSRGDNTSTSSASEALSDDFASLDDDPYSSSFATTATSSTETSRSSKPTGSSIYTPDDLSSLSATYDNINTWLERQLALQEKLSNSDDPILTVADIHTKMRELERALQRLMTKMGRQGGWEDPVGGRGRKNGKKGEKGKGKEKEKVRDKQKDQKKKKTGVKDEL